MASHVFNSFKVAVLEAWLAAAASPRVALLMSNTTADTENDGIDFVGDITTLDEFDGANYVRKTLASGTVAVDDANDRAGLDFADITWTALGAGTRSIVGILVYDHITNDAASPVGWWLEYSSPKTPDGSDFIVSINDLLRAT